MEVSIKIIEKRCKRCGLCLYYCPQKVYTCEKGAIPRAENLAACTACRLCEMHCPDFAIEVEAAK